MCAGCTSTRRSNQCGCQPLCGGTRRPSGDRGRSARHCRRGRCLVYGVLHGLVLSVMAGGGGVGLPRAPPPSAGGARPKGRGKEGAHPPMVWWLGGAPPAGVGRWGRVGTGDKPRGRPGVIDSRWTSRVRSAAPVEIIGSAAGVLVRSVSWRTVLPCTSGGAAACPEARAIIAEL